MFSSPFRRGLGKGAFNFFIIKPTLFPRLLPKGEGAYIIDLLSVQNTPVTNPPKPHPSAPTHQNSSTARQLSPKPLKKLGSFNIICHEIISSMLTAIQLNDQANFMTVKIHNIRCNHILSARRWGKIKVPHVPTTSPPHSAFSYTHARLLLFCLFIIDMQSHLRHQSNQVIKDGKYANRSKSVTSLQWRCCA